MRVLHVNDHPPGDGHGGAEVFLGRLIAAQRARGDEVDVLAGDGSHRGLRTALDLWDPASARRLRSRVDVCRPDVVHVHNVLRELSPSVLRATAVPTVLTVHDLRAWGGSEHHLPDPRAAAALVLHPLVRRMSARLPAVVGVSSAVVAALGVPGAQAIPVPVPAPTGPLQPVEDCTDVLFAGRLSEDKGIHVLLAAMERVTGGRLVVAGDGPVPVAGARRMTAHEVSEAMGGARVVVVPSLPSLRREGSSLTAAEAARHGRPLVTSDDPAVAEITRLVGGDVVPAGDVAALAARIQHWLDQPAEAAAAGARALAASAVFDAEAVAERYAAVYARVLA
ncbi:MAG: glycosyl transferase [Frankiales bacterium]|nr:glycosyl transferase [Frankiales bacterium]